MGRGPQQSRTMNTRYESHPPVGGPYIVNLISKVFLKQCFISQVTSGANI